MTGRPRPLVFAHRGGADALPEHTLGAYLRALEDGADGLECDVRMTRDGHLVCVHDRRLDRTSNGRGRVSTKTLAELDALDFGSWHHTAAEQRLLTLERLLDAVLDCGRPTRLLIETKHPTRYGSEVERCLVELLRQRGLDRAGPGDPVRVTVMSFSAIALRRIRLLAPHVPTVFLFEILHPLVRRGKLPFGTGVAGPGVELLRTRPDLVAALRAAGHEVFVWTVNHEADVDLVRGLDVDGVISDRPRFVLDRLNV